MSNSEQDGPARLGCVRNQGEDPAFAIYILGTWVPYSALGLSARTTGEAVMVWESARDAATGLNPIVRAELALYGVSEIDMACPIVAPTKILATGMNYNTHNDEMKSLAPELTTKYVELSGARPERPLLFSKHASALVGPGDNIEINTAVVTKCDYEVELALVIGKTVRNLTHDQAWGAVFGVTVANDVSARDWVLTESQFMRGKSFDTFCPIGPWITHGLTLDEVRAMTLESWVNGEQRQSASVSEMTFSIPDILVHASAATTLNPGDIVLTGTPPGVGFGRVPQVFLQAGDSVECRIAHIGSLVNTVNTVHVPAGLSPYTSSSGRESASHRLSS